MKFLEIINTHVFFNLSHFRHYTSFSRKYKILVFFHTKYNALQNNLFFVIIDISFYVRKIKKC